MDSSTARRPALVARGDQADVDRVVRARDRGRCPAEQGVRWGDAEPLETRADVAVARARSAGRRARYPRMHPLECLERTSSPLISFGSKPVPPPDAVLLERLTTNADEGVERHPGASVDSEVRSANRVDVDPDRDAVHLLGAIPASSSRVSMTRVGDLYAVDVVVPASQRRGKHSSNSGIPGVPGGRESRTRRCGCRAAGSRRAAT